MESIYTSGAYLETTATWHEEDSPWKATQIANIVARNRMAPQRVAEIGCGVGRILQELSTKEIFRNAHFEGYDISAQAIQLAGHRSSERVNFFCEDLLARNQAGPFDLLLVIDVFEHVPDYLGFLRRCRGLARRKVYHIPLDLSASSVLRNAFIAGRYGLGHLHYFTADAALAALRDTGHTIVDYCYTNAAIDLFSQHPSIRKAVANVPRWLLSRFSVPLAARALGGYSLLVLTE